VAVWEIFERDARFWRKLLMRTTFDATTESSQVLRRTPKSTTFGGIVEAQGTPTTRSLGPPGTGRHSVYTK